MTDPALAIPASLDEIDAEFVGAALSAEVASVRRERIAVGEGFLGELARVFIDYAPGSSGPATLIAKIPTTDGALKPVGLMLDVYEREHRVYREVVPQLRVRTPAVHCNLGDAETARYCLLIEDIAHLTAGDQAAGCTLAQARAAMAAAAGLHGRWWGKADTLAWVPPIDSDLNLGLQDLYEAAFPAAVDEFGELIGADVIAHLERFLPTVRDMLTGYGPMSRTLVHNDFRLDNMFFDDDELVLIDWQLLGRGEGMGDVCQFLSANISSDLRRALEQELLRLYFETTSEQGSGYLNFDDLLDSYRISLNFWTLNWCYTGATAADTNQRAAELFEAMISRSVDAYRQHRAWEMIGSYEPHDRLH